jgi:hypothetical protein
MTAQIKQPLTALLKCGRQKERCNVCIGTTTFEHMDTPQTPLEYEAWYNANEQELTCMAAESGADRERGFDSEAFAEEQYDKYLKTFANT